MSTKSAPPGPETASRKFEIEGVELGYPTEFRDGASAAGMFLVRSAVANELISEWVQSGGTLLVIGSAISWATGAGLLELEERPFDTDSLLTGTNWGTLGVARSAQSISGTILDARLDSTHPLSFGIGDRLPLFVASSEFFEPSPVPGRSVGVYSENPRLSGWLSEAREAQVSGAAAISVARKGRGRVIAIHAYPAFRGYWRGGARLVWNSVLFGPTL